MWCCPKCKCSKIVKLFFFVIAKYNLSVCNLLALLAKNNFHLFIWSFCFVCKIVLLLNFVIIYLHSWICFLQLYSIVRRLCYIVQIHINEWSSQLYFQIPSRFWRQFANYCTKNYCAFCSEWSRASVLNGKI